MSSLRTIVMRAGVLGTVLLALVGCEEKASKGTSSKAPKPDDEPATLDPNLGKAIAATSAAAQRPGQPAPSAGDGPPPNGVFTPERAKEIHGVGDPTSIEVGSTGTEPRVSLSPQGGDIPKKLTFTVVTQLGPQRSLPSIDMTFGLQVSKPKKLGEGDAAPGAAINVASTLSKAVLSVQQPAQIPAEVEKEVAKMKGSKLGWAFVPAGGITNISLERAKNSRAELEHNLVAVTETLAVASLSAPQEPVGVGAAWVARSRDIYGGLDLISYRMFRVTKIDGDEVTYNVETRQYASSPEMSKAGLPEGGELLQFECTGTGELVITRGDRLANKGTFTHNMRMGLRPPDASGNQVMPLILQSTISFPVDG